VAVLGVLYQGQRKKRGCGVTCPERCTPKPVSQWGKFFAICHFYKNVIDWEKCCIHWRAHLLQTWTCGRTAKARLKLMRCRQVISVDVHQAFKNMRTLHTRGRFCYYICSSSYLLKFSCIKVINSSFIDLKKSFNKLIWSCINDG
jgi:hypothetical protein